MPRAGLITAPGGAGRDPSVDVAEGADVAEVAAAVLPGGYDGTALDLSGPEAISFPGAAQVLALVSGTAVRFADWARREVPSAPCVPAGG